MELPISSWKNIEKWQEFSGKDRIPFKMNVLCICKKHQKGIFLHMIRHNGTDKKRTESVREQRVRSWLEVDLSCLKAIQNVS